MPAGLWASAGRERRRRETARPAPVRACRFICPPESKGGLDRGRIFGPREPLVKNLPRKRHAHDEDESCGLLPRGGPFSSSCHVVPGEAGDALVVVGKVLELGAGDVAVKIVEVNIAHQLLDAADEIVGRMLAVGAYDARRRCRAPGLVRLEGGRWLAPRGQAIGE